MFNRYQNMNVFWNGHQNMNVLELIYKEKATETVGGDGDF